MAQAGEHVKGLGLREIPGTIVWGLLHVTQHPDACTGAIAQEAGKLLFRLIYTPRTTLVMFRPI